jgi:hypothetical protein
MHPLGDISFLLREIGTLVAQHHFNQRNWILWGLVELAHPPSGKGVGPRADRGRKAGTLFSDQRRCIAGTSYVSAYINRADIRT